MDEVRIEEAKYRSLTETARDIIVSCDLRGHLQYVNNMGLEFFGLDAANYQQKNVFDYMLGADQIMKIFRERRDNSSNTVVFDITIPSSNGEQVPFEVNSTFIELSNGRYGVLSILRNISERKAAEAKLVTQNNELQLINSELDKFVYRTSHDLRAPLTSVLGLIDIIRESFTDNGEIAVYMEMMEKSIFRLDNVIRSIIEYSKSNRLQVKHEYVKIEEIYADIVESIGFMSGYGSLHHASSMDAASPFVSDETAIITILNNLITNAVKYRRPVNDSFVRFTYKCDSEKAMLQVADNGEGIPKDKTSLIFDMFYRNSVTADGSGLGLYIVKQNVQKLGGSIEVASEPGVGSTFTIWLPNHHKSAINVA